jgi:hypothetical protein
MFFKKGGDLKRFILFEAVFEGPALYDCLYFGECFPSLIKDNVGLFRMVADLRHDVFSLLRLKIGKCEDTKGRQSWNFVVSSCFCFFAFSRQQSENTTEGWRKYDT